MTTTPPTLVSYTSGGFTGTTSPKTASVTVLSGDQLVCVGTTENNATTLSTPTGGTSIAWTLKKSLTGSNLAPVYIWTAPVTSGQTFSVSVGRASGTGETGMGVFVYRGSTGIGASNSASGTTGTPTVSLTTTGADSAIVIVNSDWETISVTGRTYLQINSASPTDETATSGNSSYYVAAYGDSGAAGAKTAGLSAPAGQHWQTAVVEILGTTSGGGPTLQQSAGFFGAPS